MNCRRCGSHGQKRKKLGGSMVFPLIRFWNCWCDSDRRLGPYNQKVLRVPPSTHGYHSTGPLWGWIIGESLQDIQSNGDHPNRRLGGCTRRVCDPQFGWIISFRYCTTFRRKQCVTTSHWGQRKTHPNEKPDMEGVEYHGVQKALLSYQQLWTRWLAHLEFHSMWVRWCSWPSPDSWCHGSCGRTYWTLPKLSMSYIA